MKTIVGFLSRPHGFNVLKALAKNKKYKLLKVYTHSLKPSSEDPDRSERIDYPKFQKFCKNHNISLVPIDSKNKKIYNFPNCDYIVEVSWRYIIPESIIQKARIASLGIHRGLLPNYAGREPIKHALEKNEKEIILTSHKLANVIDKGEILLTISHPVVYQNKKSFEENIQRLREEITPFFSKLVLRTLEKIEMMYTKKECNIILKRITRSDENFLYQLLLERDPIANISHKKMPTPNKHKNFVMSNPYAKWYIIIYNNQKVGSIYFSRQNEIGIHLKKQFQNKGIGTIAVKTLIQKHSQSRFLANINPKNKKSIKFFKKHGFKLIQYTYELTKD